MDNVVGRRVLVLLGGIFIALMFVDSVSADTAYVYGVIYDADTLAPVSDADVIVTCDTPGGTVSTISGVDGSYNAPPIECLIGTTVTVSATKDTRSGSEQGTISPSGMAEIGVALVDVPISAPEAIAVLVAIMVLAPMLSYVLVRRHQKNRLNYIQNQ